MPPAPARFSTITGCPIDAESFGPSRRMMRSGGPPAVEGTITWIGLLGNAAVCAEALHDRSTVDAAASAITARVNVVSRSRWRWRRMPRLLAVRFNVGMGDRLRRLAGLRHSSA